VEQRPGKLAADAVDIGKSDIFEREKGWIDAL